MAKIKASKNAMYKLVLDQAEKFNFVLPLPASKKEIAFRGDENNIYHLGWASGSYEFMFWLGHHQILILAVFDNGKCVDIETTLIPLDTLRRKGMVVEDAQ